jgi:hypothetical protein
VYQTLKHYGYGHSKVKKLRVFASIVEAYPRFGAIAVSYDKIVNMSASLKRFFTEHDDDEDVASTDNPLSSAFWKSTSPRYNMNDEGVGTSEEEEHDDDDLVSRLSDSLSEASLEDDEP